MSTKKVSRKVDKPKAIILDIEGTTTDTTFVSKIAHLIWTNLEKFLDETYESPETNGQIRQLRQLQLSGAYGKMPPVVVGSRKQVVSSVADNIKWQIAKGKHTTQLKLLEILCWLWAYEKDLIAAHIYDDVSPCLHDWKTKAGIRIYTFSSAMSLAQQLLFAKTNHGNVHSLFDDFFDSSMGSKTDSQSYNLISNKIGVDANQILFITDDPKEAKTAIDAGLKSMIIKRPGNKATDEYPDIPRINSFNEIKF